MRRLSVTALALAACVRQLPPAATPAPVAPPSLQQAGAPAEGMGRLIVDVVDGPAPVQRIRMEPKQISLPNDRTGYRFEEAPETLCSAAPCVTDLPVGNVLLGFPVIGNRDASEIELVHVGPQTAVYRRALSIYDDRTGATRVLGIISTSVGAAAAITGTVLLPVGLSDGNNSLTTAGGITLGAGALLLAIGIWAIRHDAPTFRPGASNHFPL